MSTLRDRLNQVKENAVKASSELPADLWKMAAHHLINRGDFAANGIRLVLKCDSGDERRYLERFTGIRGDKNGTAAQTSSFTNVLEWLLRPMNGPVRVSIRRIWPVSDLYRKTDPCPFCDETSQWTGESTNGIVSGTWRGCDHFIDEIWLGYMWAVFIAHADDVRSCWRCDNWTSEHDDTCVHCEAVRSADPGNDSQNRLDAWRLD